MRNILYYGQSDPLPERFHLRAGPLSLIYEAGGLRTICLEGPGSGQRIEVIRRIYVAVRDRNWGTVPAALSNLQVDRAAASFQISYEAVNQEREIDFAWHGLITGSADGQIIFKIAGTARSTFLTNRIGFCVLYPAACAADRAVVEHMDGSQELAAFPLFINADQPVQPFADLRSIRHEADSGIWLEMRFQGGVFEMEDQRNWTDASYKIYCPPLRLPFPVQVQQGSQRTQSVTLSVEQQAAGSRPTNEKDFAELHAPAPITLAVNTLPTWPLPSIGLCSASHDQPLTDLQIERLRALHLDHLRVDLDLSDPAYPARLRNLVSQAHSLGVPLAVALFLTENSESELALLLENLKQAAVPGDNPPEIASWLVFPARESYQGEAASGLSGRTQGLVRLARRYLGSFESLASFGAGTNHDFIFLQRNPPPLDLLDFICFSINPQVHAFDNDSVIETLEAQAAAVASARQLSYGLPVMVSPVTLRPRHNPYATGVILPVPPGELPPQVDVRQMSLLGAGWTLGSLKSLTEGGAHCLTYYETTGWRGVMELESGSPLPDKFHSLPSMIFPLYHVLGWVGEFSGGQVLPVLSSSPQQAVGLALHKEDRRRVLLANLTSNPLTIHLGTDQPESNAQPAHPFRATRVRMLDEGYAHSLTVLPSGIIHSTSSGGLEFSLLPFAVACVEGSAT